MKKILIIFLAVLVFAGCSSNNDEEITVESVDYKIPKPWVKEEPNDQLKFEQYLLPGYENSSPAELSVFRFPNGDQSKNYAERWLDMIKHTGGEKTKNIIQVDTLQVKDLTVEIFGAKGIYIEERKPIVMGGPKNINDNYQIILAVVDNENTEWQFRILGPEKTLEYWEPSIKEFLNSFSI